LPEILALDNPFPDHSAMQAISRRLQLELIGAGYALVFLFAAAEYFQRYLYTLREPIDSAGGMAAFGDEMLTIFVFLLFLAPTFFLLRLMANSDRMAQSDRFYESYAKVLLAVSITDPLAVGLLALFHNSILAQDICGTRLWRSPMVLVVMIMSRALGRRGQEKRLMTWAILIEAGTLVASVAIFLMMAGRHE
jgi:hypothetical protein